MIPLTKLQKEIMKEFYELKPTKIVFNKKQRNILWKKATAKEDTLDFDILKKVCPALEHQIRKSYENNQNIQSAVFSECVYAQTLANMLQLNLFVNCLEDGTFIPTNVKDLLKSYNLVPRYAYSTTDKSKMLIQAGGHNGIDSALITVMDLNIYTIEFKEQGAKTSEPDLPKYKEDGKLIVTKDFLEKYPQFELMLNEKRGLNFFEVMGSNVNDFTEESINVAITNNYTKKYADVICTEDVNGYLVMIPANQISLWAKIEGEIRPAGRNHYKVWTPKSLKIFLKDKEAVINEKEVIIKKDKMDIRKQRGGNRSISGYKINPLFFVFIKDCKDNNGYIRFNIDKIRQLQPTITGKIFFKNLKYNEVKNYYN